MNFVFGCNIDKPVEYLSTDKCFPKIVIEPINDTVKIGEIFEVKISLSDTSVLTVPEYGSSKRKKYYPVFRINGEIIPNHFSNHYTVRHRVSEAIVYEEDPNYREIECSVIFPHPIIGEGSIELAKLITYRVSPAGLR